MDFKKTILWAVFALSGLMLYNNWLIHEGKPSLFGGAPVSSNSSPATKAGSEKNDVPMQASADRKSVV